LTAERVERTHFPSIAIISKFTSFELPPISHINNFSSYFYRGPIRWRWKEGHSVALEGGSFGGAGRRAYLPVFDKKEKPGE
jgi:hypothetical protein